MSDRTIDQITIEKIEYLQREAHERGLDIDWESLTLVPYRTDGSPPEQELGDNNARSPEQADWEQA